MLTVEQLDGWMAELAHLREAADSGVGDESRADDAPHGGDDDAQRIDLLRRLEELKSAAAATQACITVAFDRSQRAVQAAAGVPARKLGAGVGAQVALARRDSPVKGARHLGLARALVHEMPHTLAALGRGEISEWRATVVARETACLSRSDRSTVDAELAARPGGLAGLGDRATAAEAARIAYRLDPYAFTARARKAEADRRVTCRPAPDTMAMVSGLLPAKQGIAVYAALLREADTRRSQGDTRTKGQVMADTLVERVTGQASAAGVPVEVNLVMTDRSLLGAGTGHGGSSVDGIGHDGASGASGVDEPAHLEGYGPVPAPLAREDLVALPEDVAVWLRRLYAEPGTGALVAMESTRRVFSGTHRRMLVIRDQQCRTPWCDAPVRHVDHVTSVARGGRTTTSNGQSLCEACNYTKETAGWVTDSSPDGVIETRTPTGHRYLSRPPPLPGSRPQTSAAGVRPASRVDLFYRDDLRLIA